MSIPKSSSHKPFFNGEIIYILIVMAVIVYLKISLKDIKQQEPSEPIVKTYEDKLMIAEGDKYNSVEYQCNLVTTRMNKKYINIKLKFLEKEIESSYKLLLETNNMSGKELGITADYRNDSNSYRTLYITGIYKKLYSHDSKVFDRVAELFNQIASEEKLSRMDSINLITSMVQNIKYEVPKLTSFEVLSPTLCIDYRYGDCDTKTLLLLLILRKIGVDCVHLDSEKYSHAMIGINAPSTGEYKEYRGNKYYFLETTSSGWYIGILPPDVNNKAYWNVLNY